MIKPQFLSHAALKVTNVERARNFYENLLGLKPLPRPNFGFGGAWYEVGENQIHLISLRTPDEQAEFLGTWEKQGPKGINPLGPHVAIVVEDYDRTKAELKESGIEFLEAPANMAGRQLWILDPDGNTIELRAQK
jgi:glyoxylase I family protein